jgi:hypothetical protein
MASTVKHLRSSTANKRPTASGLAEGQLAINTASGTPGLFLKDSAGAVVKVGPAHVGTSAPNATPAGSAGNSTGELWVNNSATIHGLNYYTGSAFVNLTPSGTATVAGLVELATDAETQTGTDTVRAVTPSGLQSKISDSISTTSSTTIASSTAVKAAYDLANAALPKSGGRVTGALEIGPVGSLVFEGSSDDSFETTLAVVNPTAARTITFPNVTGTVVTTGDSGTVTSAMIADGAIVNADINASAAIVDTKLATIATAGKVSNSATTAASANTASAIVARDGSGNFTAGTITAALTGAASSNVLKAGDTMTGALVVPLASASTPSLTFTGDLNTGIYSPGADQLAISTNGTGRLFVDASGNVGVGAAPGAYRFDIQGGGQRILNQGGVSFLEIGNGTTTSQTAYVDLVTDTTYTDFGLRLLRDGGANAVSQLTHRGTGELSLRTQEAAPITFYTTNTERARIDSSGRLGIGTSSPVAPLTVSNGTVNLILSPFSTEGYIGTATNHALPFVTNNTERVRVDSSGNVGIGTTSPTTPLQVVGTVTATTFVGALTGNASTVTTNANLTGDITSVGNATAIASGVIVNADINASAAIADTKLATIATAGKVSGTAITSGDIATSGNLEITNATPSVRLTESDGTATHSQTVLIKNADQFSIQTRNSVGALLSNDYLIPANASGATDHIWRIGNTEKARLDSTGALLVGTTAEPTGVADGDIALQDRLVMNASAGNYGQLQRIVDTGANLTATTGTIVFKFKSALAGSHRSAFVKINLSGRANNSTPSNSPACEYAFQLHQTSGGVCTINGTTTIFEYTFVRATHFAFADLGSGECTVTLTNPTGQAVTPAYMVEINTQAGTFGLDAVTVT